MNPHERGKPTPVALRASQTGTDRRLTCVFIGRVGGETGYGIVVLGL
jgi:hypothetical protein